MSATAAGFAARRLAQHAAASGIPARTVAGWFGLDGDEVALPARVPIERLYGAWAAIARELEDPAVGVRSWGTRSLASPRSPPADRRPAGRGQRRSARHATASDRVATPVS